MATTKTASPKKSQGFQGVRAAFWIIVACFIIALLIFNLILGDPKNFVNNDPTGAVLNGNYSVQSTVVRSRSSHPHFVAYCTLLVYRAFCPAYRIL